jgi:hypothetical protein
MQWKASIEDHMGDSRSSDVRRRRFGPPVAQRRGFDRYIPDGMVVRASWGLRFEDYEPLRAIDGPDVAP